jgi:hypothetical protein
MSGPGAIAKPTVFLSHAATDQPVAQVIHDEIGRIFANGVTVYASSVPGVVKPGQDWLASIRDHLAAATAVIVIVTPVSINRPWIWFEVGASWSKMEQHQNAILPLVYGVEKDDLPEPLKRLQAMSLSKASETKEVFQTLVTNFGFGNMKGFRHGAIKQRLPKYGDLEVAELDIESGTLYTGPYQGYSDGELSDVIEEGLVRPEWRDWENRFVRPFGTMLFAGEIIHFRAVDEELDLPPGTAKRLLPRVVSKGFYPAEVYRRTQNTIRFIVDDRAYEALQLQREA